MKNLTEKVLIAIIGISLLTTAGLNYIVYLRLLESEAHISQLEVEAKSLKLHLQKLEGR